MLNFTPHIYRLFVLKPFDTYKINLLLLICLSLFFGCKNSKSISSNPSEIERTPKILFLNYSIENTSNGNRVIQFINKKIVDGKLKPNQFESIENAIVGDLIFTELDKKSKVLNQILIKNPLIRRIEYVNDSKNFKTKTIKSDKMQFSIRLQLKNTTKYVTISNFAETEPLIKTQIN